MDIGSYAKDSLVAQFKDVEGDITLKGYVLNKWERDESFRRWLFENPMLPDNWAPGKAEDILFRDFLESLPDIEHVSKDRARTIMDNLYDELENNHPKKLFSLNGYEIDIIQKPKPLFEKGDYFVEEDGYPFITYTDADKFEDERSAIVNSKIIEVRDGKMVVMENIRMGQFMLEGIVPSIVPSMEEKKVYVSYNLIKFQEPNIAGRQYNVQVITDGYYAGNGRFFTDYQSAVKYIIEDRLSRGDYYDPMDQAKDLFINPLLDTTTFVGDRESSSYICDQESLYEEKSTLNSTLYDDWCVLLESNGQKIPHLENWDIADIPVKNGRVQLMDIVNSSSLEYSDGGYTYIYRSKDNELYLDSEKLDLVKSFPSSAERRDWVLDLVTPLNLHKGEGCLLRYLDHSEVYRFNENEWKAGVTDLNFLDSNARLARSINYEIDENRLEWLREHLPIETQQSIYEKLIDERTAILLNLNMQDPSTKKVYSLLEKEIDNLESRVELVSDLQAKYESAIQTALEKSAESINLEGTLKNNVVEVLTQYLQGLKAISPDTHLSYIASEDSNFLVSKIINGQQARDFYFLFPFLYAVQGRTPEDKVQHYFKKIISSLSPAFERELQSQFSSMDLVSFDQVMTSKEEKETPNTKVNNNTKVYDSDPWVKEQDDGQKTLKSKQSLSPIMSSNRLTPNKTESKKLKR